MALVIEAPVEAVDVASILGDVTADVLSATTSTIDETVDRQANKDTSAPYEPWQVNCKLLYSVYFCL